MAVLYIGFLEHDILICGMVAMFFYQNYLMNSFCH